LHPPDITPDELMHVHIKLERTLWRAFVAAARRDGQTARGRLTALLRTDAGANLILQMTARVAESA
jgi:hypothetical protein